MGLSALKHRPLLSSDFGAARHALDGWIGTAIRRSKRLRYKRQLHACGAATDGQNWSRCAANRRPFSSLISHLSLAIRPPDIAESSGAIPRHSRNPHSFDGTGAGLRSGRRRALLNHNPLRRRAL
jgi:hypothetical protein